MRGAIRSLSEVEGGRRRYQANKESGINER